MKKDAVYFCLTPFHIMTAIALVVSRKETADIYIEPGLDNVDGCINIIKSSGIFANVYNLGDQIWFTKDLRHKTGLYRKILIFALYAGVNYYGSKIFQNNKYKKVYAYDLSYLRNWLATYITKNNIETELLSYEDGESSYDGVYIGEEGTKIKFLKKILFLPELKSNMFIVKYLYSPDLYRAIHRNTVTELKQLPLWNSNDVETAIASVFGKAKGISERYILLDAIASEWLDKQQAQQYISLLYEIGDVVGEDNVIIKKHPRDLSNYGATFRIYDERKVPFESICRATTDMENKVIIALSSTAVLTPKLLFNKEPYVILLYKLFDLKIGMNKERDILYTNLKKQYVHQTRFYIPNCKEELLETLYDLQRCFTVMRE